MEPRSTLDTSLDKHHALRDAETSDRGLSVDDVEVEESDNDGPSTIVRGHVEWVHMRPCKLHVDGDRTTAKELGRKRSSPLNNVHTSIHMDVEKDGIPEHIKL